MKDRGRLRAALGQISGLRVVREGEHDSHQKE